MPTYTYQCTECGHAFDLFHGMMENGTRPCPLCSAESMRKIGAGAGLIFKGTGFYETDYKRKKGKNGSAMTGSPSPNTIMDTKSEEKSSPPKSDTSKAKSADPKAA
jgi:putative FmdB family regulatory protein